MCVSVSVCVRVGVCAGESGVCVSVSACVCVCECVCVRVCKLVHPVMTRNTASTIIMQEFVTNVPPMIIHFCHHPSS